MSDCLICRKHQDPSQQANRVYLDADWAVYHSSETNILGYFLIESRRHILDLSEATAEEASSYGSLLKLMTTAMRQVVDCQRIYTLSLGEMVPHCHFHLIPRRPDLPRAFRGRGIVSYPITPKADPALVSEVCLRVRRAIASCVPIG